MRHLSFCPSAGPRVAGSERACLPRSFDIARHVAAVLSASFKAPDGRYLGVQWSPFEAVLYVRVLAENEDFTDRLVRFPYHCQSLNRRVLIYPSLPRA